MNLKCAFGFHNAEYIYFGLSLCEEHMIVAERCAAEGDARTTAAIEAHVHAEADRDDDRLSA